MNCRDFEDIVNGLVRAKMIDAAMRERGLAHTEACDRCAARLADERELSAGLKALAASDEAKAAPVGVETALLAAFRQHPVRQPVSPRWPRWALAAAAMILVAIGFVVYRAFQNTSPERKRDDQVVVATPSPEREKREVNPPVADDKSAGDGAAERRVNRFQKAASRSNPSAKRFFIRDGLTLYAGDSEITSDFFPLTHDEASTPLESGQLIRVQMPRTALVAFGFPVNVERADVPVKADLLVGEDGLARAIRFVR